MGNEELKDISGTVFPCLDSGFVRLIDVMGDDSAIVQAARVSYGAGTKSINEDRGLIRYLMRNRHTSPFEMVEFKFHVKLPIFVARQWIRHRTANVNEYSGRYSEMKDDFYLPDSDQLRPQSSMNKQGREADSEPLPDSDDIVNKMAGIQDFLYENYKSLLDKGLARELARINLPVSNYTEWYWKIDLHNLFHFLNLRLDKHAQYEIRVYAEVISHIIKPIVPFAYEAFEDYVLNSVTFTGKELHMLKSIVNNLEITEENIEKLGLKGREAQEFKDKISYINNF